MRQIGNEFFAQEDLEEALNLITKQQAEWKQITGLSQNKFRARNALVWQGKLTRSHMTALLHEWGK